MAYDTIVIGGGHNGLTTAATLGKAGQSVLVLEAAPHMGGVAASQEFHPGFRNAGLLADSTAIRPHVVDALRLREHGLVLRGAAPDVAALGTDHDCLLLSGSVERAAAAISERNPDDGARYPEYVAFMQRLAPAIRDVFDRPAIDIVDIEAESMWGLAKRGLSVRRLGRADMTELLRLPVMCVADVVSEWFSDPLLRSALSLPAVLGTFTGPWSPGNAINLLRQHALAGPGVVGGGPMLIQALLGAAEASGVQLRTGAEVTSIEVGPTGVRGVVLANGERIEARRIAAGCDAKTTLLRLLPVGAIPHRLERNVGNLRTRGSMAHVSFALEGDVTLGGHGAEFARTGAHVDDIERAYDAIKYREPSPTPILELHVPTVTDPELAPRGNSVVTALASYAPHDPLGGWTDLAREAMGDRVQAALAVHIPDLASRVIARSVLSPADLAAAYRLPGGDIFHGEHSLDQLLVRPSPECIHHRTPVDGLWLCSSGTHPGGGLTCGPGYLAAQAILQR